MRKILFTVLLALPLLAGCGKRAPKAAIATDKAIEAKVEKTLARMSLEEKVGQMAQLEAPLFVRDGKLTAEGDSLLRNFKIGSVLNTPEGHAEAPGTFNSIIRQINAVSMEETGIPVIFGLDHIHGTTYIDGGVLFPQEINIGATFNREHAFNVGEVTAYESRAASVPWTFSPTMDLGRNPSWSRMWESFGEDVHVNAEMAVAMTKGLQGENPNAVDRYHIAACAKHYMGYGVPVSGQDRTPSSISRSQLREKFFEPFKRALDAGALTLMVNSGNDNGMPFHCNTELLTQWVKEDLDWDGMIVTDWADINNLFTRDKVASSKKEAVKLAINAGIDMAMVPYEAQFCTDLLELVKEGEVPMSRIDDAVRRVLRLKYRLGLFDAPDADAADYPDFGSDGHKYKAYRAAVESEVMLKNNGTLPVARNARILLAGPNANSMRTLNGGWSYTWQGNGAAREEFTGSYNTILEAMQAKFASVTYVPGVEYSDPYGTSWKEDKITGIATAKAAARNADVIVCCVGENSYCETPGNDNDLNLSANQKLLVRELASCGKPLVLILNEGRPRIVNDIEPLASAVVDIMLPGNFGGDALAALLCGEENFSGRLPFTYPKYVNKFATYDYKPCEKVGTMAGAYNYDATMDVQWHFGYGLSYTSFKYSDMRVAVEGAGAAGSAAAVDGTAGAVAKADGTANDAAGSADRDAAGDNGRGMAEVAVPEFRSGDIIKVSVDVTNTGSVAGMESVLLYSSDLYASSTPDVRRLRDFQKISLAPGECRTVTFTIPADALAFVDYNERWTLEKGDFVLTAGDCHAGIRCSETKVWKEPNIR